MLKEMKKELESLKELSAEKIKILNELMTETETIGRKIKLLSQIMDMYEEKSEPETEPETETELQNKIIYTKPTIHTELEFINKKPKVIYNDVVARTVMHKNKKFKVDPAPRINGNVDRKAASEKVIRLLSENEEGLPNKIIMEILELSAPDLNNVRYNYLKGVVFLEEGVLKLFKPFGT